MREEEEAGLRTASEFIKKSGSSEQWVRIGAKAYSWGVIHREKFIVQLGEATFADYSQSEALSLLERRLASDSKGNLQNENAAEDLVQGTKATVTRRGDQFDICEEVSAEDLARIEQRGKVRVAHTSNPTRKTLQEGAQEEQVMRGSGDIIVEVADVADFSGPVKSKVVENTSSTSAKDPLHTAIKARFKESLFRRRALGMDNDSQDCEGRE